MAGTGLGYRLFNDKVLTGRRIAAAIGLGTTLILGGCATADYGSAEMAISPAAPIPAPAVMAPGSADAGFAYDTDTAEAGGMGEIGMVEMPASVDADRVSANREIIMTGSGELLAPDPPAAASAIASYVEAMGGNIASRREWRATPNSPGSAFLSLRIPSGSLNSMIDGLSQFGEVRSVSVDQWDVTAQGQDLDARITALQTSVTRLTELLATAGDTGDLLQVERELSNRQADLDALRAARVDLTGRVQMSQLELSINPTPDAAREAEPYTGFIGGLQRGWNALLGFFRGLAVVIGAVLPWLLAIGVVAALLTPLIRWLRKRKTARWEQRNAPAPAPSERIVVAPQRRVYDDEDD